MAGEGNSGLQWVAMDCNGLQWVPLWKKPQAVINQPDDPQPNPDCTTYICANINKLHQYGNYKALYTIQWAIVVDMTGG